MIIDVATRGVVQLLEIMALVVSYLSIISLKRTRLLVI